ncbi:lamin tail domain-containing protein [Litoribacter populi]|uniref:lamin tail domain-containing protein n=1 Tax=Litoribacter populi TaxID=2598460 RepID=UPI00117F77F0|nr:lamin tail domain-containing protein [Litoribacter populi]
MRTFLGVWVWFALSILGFTFFSKTDFFTGTQDFESNFEITNHPEEFLPYWSANEIRSTAARVFQAKGEGVNLSNALGIQVISTFNAEIFIHTSTLGMEDPVITFQAKTNQNGSGNRPVYLFYSIASDLEKTFSPPVQVGEDNSFPNQNTEYKEFQIKLTQEFLNVESLWVKLEAKYGNGSGTAARLFIDDFTIMESGENPEPPKEKEDENEVLKLLEHKIISPHSLELTFSSADISSHANRYFLSNNYGNPKNIEINGENVRLDFDAYLYSNSYLLEVNQDGNSLSFEIELVTSTPQGSILINEFMADPNPKSLTPPQPTLPTGATDEYIELFNNTDYDISLEGFTYNNRTLENSVIKAQSYVMLVSMGKKETFEPFGQVIGVNSFQALPNSSGNIVLKDRLGNLVDSLSYDLSWYGSSQKSNGGWSLERKNPFLNCSDQDNWTASIAPGGGTPGAINSVFDDSIDEKAFTLIDHSFQGDSLILLYFSQPLQPSKVPHTVIRIDGQQGKVIEMKGKGISLLTPFRMEDGKTYELAIEGLEDCNGRKFVENKFQLLFDTRVPNLQRISPISTTVLNLVFDKILGTVTRNNFSLQDSQPLQVAKLDSSRVQLIFGTHLPFGEKQVLTLSDIPDTRGNVQKIQEFDFILEDQVDTLRINSPFGLSIRFHKSIEASSILPANFWVDRNTGNPVAAFADHEDPRTVHLVFDKSLPQNNLTWLQIENLKDEAGEYIYTLSRSFVRDMRTIGVTQILAPNDSVLLLTFNKPLLQNKAEIPGNYTVDSEVLHPFRASQKSQNEVELIFKNKFTEGKEYRLSTIGLEDVYGVVMSRTVNTNFIYDLSPPKIASHRFLSPFELAIQFNKPVQPITTQQVKLGGKTPLEIYQQNQAHYILQFETPAIDYSQLELWEIADLLENIADYITLDLGGKNLEIGRMEIISPNHVLLTFSDFLDPKTSIFSDRYFIQGSHPSSVEIEENGYQVSLHLEQNLILMDSVFAEISVLKNMAEARFTDLRDQLIYEDGVEHIDIQTANSLMIHHAVPVVLLEEMAFQFEESDISIQAFTNQTAPELTHLILSKPLEESQTYTLLLPRRKVDSRNFLPGSRRIIVFDRTAPKIGSVEAHLENEIMVTFDEDLDPIMAMVANHYQLDGVHPQMVISAENSNQVILHFGAPLEDKSTYNLFVHRIEDLNGNSVEGDYFSFTFEKPYAPSFKEIVINEVMAAPREGQTLPNAEYVELYNTGSQAIQIGGYRLANSRSSTVLPRFVLQPESYLILSAQSQASNFQPFGPSLGLSNWPALLNGGDEVKLLDRSGQVLDSLEYITASYGGTEFAQGGYSLEVVNPFQTCNTFGNLRPSSTSERGTPGKPNAVFDPTPDRTQPGIQKLTILDSVSVLITFSKPMQERLSEQYFNLEKNDIHALTYHDLSRTEVLLVFSKPLEKNTQFQLHINDFRDCLGNLLSEEDENQLLLLPGEASSGDIIINEVLFNPLTGSPKFVEILNTSTQYLSLKNWKLANFANEEISNRRIISSQDLILPPNGYLAITTDANQLLQIYPKSENLHELASLPSYPIREGTVILLDPEENFVERFDYHEKLHNPLLKEVKGVSLERLQAVGNGNNPKNWHSASGNIGWATPGFKNSQNMESPNSASMFTVSPEIFAPDAVGVQPYTSIHYQMDEPGYLATIQILGINGRLLKEITQNQILGQNGFYIWNGTDEKGAKQRPGYYIIWIQLTHPKGRVEQIRKTVAIGSKLR